MLKKHLKKGCWSLTLPREGMQVDGLDIVIEGNEFCTTFSFGEGWLNLNKEIELVEGEEKGDKKHPIVNVNMMEIVHDMSWKWFSKRPISTTTFFLRLRWQEPQLKMLEIHVHFQAQLKNRIFYKYIFFYQDSNDEKKWWNMIIYIYIYIV